MNQITSIANSIFSAILTLGPTLPLVPFIPPVIYHVLQSEFKRELLAIKDTVTWDQEYDYIVIGSGSGGSVMAARLSEDPTKTVLLLEAGWAENFLSVIPVVAFFLQKTPMDWNFKTLPQTRSCFGLNNRESVWPRGKAFGGCTAINVMLYVRGNPRDFDQWAADGAYGWSWAEIFPYFIKSEDNRDPEYVATGYHGVGGPLTVSTATDPTKIAQAFRDAGPDLGYPIGDLNGPIQSTFAIPQRTIRDGERCSIARAYLQPLVGRKNLHILGKSFVTKILFNDQKRAIGVEFDRTFVRHVVYARNEIILSAGSINSPKILMLSGIGHADHLNSMGIPVIADLPVGDNLQEHVASGVSFVLNDSVSLDMIVESTPYNILDYFVEKKNKLTSNLLEGISFVKTKYEDQSDDWPDIEFQMLPGSMATDYGMRFRDIQGVRLDLWEQVFKPYVGLNTFTIYPTIVRPKSRGWIRLKSSDPYEPPLIEPNFFDDEQDLKVLVEGMKMAYKLGFTPAFQKYGAQPFLTLYPGCESFRIYSDEYFECVVKVYTTAIWHPAGTCKMGAYHDLSAVVDPQLRVKGVKGLRVVDASIMPNVISGNLNAPTVAIAEKISDHMKGRRLKPFLPPMSKEMIENLPELPYEEYYENWL